MKHPKPHEILNAIAGELTDTLSKLSAGELDAAAEMIFRSPRVFLAGAGRSGLAIRGLAMRLMHLGKPAFVVGDTTTPGIARGDLLVIGSGSGRTASLAAAAQKAQDIGAEILLLTIDPDSPIGKLATATVRIPAPSPKLAGVPGASVTSGRSGGGGIQPMGSLFEQTLWVACDALVIALMAKTGETSETMFQRHANLE